MAGAGYKLFNTGDVLTAAQVNTYLQEQTVMVFASSTARTTALSGVLAEGMMSYLQDTNAVEVYNGSAWTAVGGGGLSSPLTTKGDVWGYSTTNARIPVGANGTVLTADSAESLGVKWATPASGGMTSIASGSLSGAQVDITGIAGTYKNLMLVVRNYDPANDTTSMRLRLNADSNNRYASSAGGSATNATFGSSSWQLTEDADNGTSTALVITEIYDYANATTWKMGNTRSVSNNTSDANNYDYINYQHYYNQTAAITQLNLLPASGNFSGGTYILYGVS